MSGPAAPSRRPPEPTLAPLPRARIGEVLHLALASGQDIFVGHIAQMVLEARDEVDFHTIRLGDEAVGFFKIDRRFDRRDPRLGHGAVGLRGLLIDAARQNEGIGRAALARLPGYLRGRHPGLSRLWLTADPANLAAHRVYRRTGWREVPLSPFPGRSAPETVLALDLDARRIPRLRLAPLPDWAVADVAHVVTSSEQERPTGSIAEADGRDVDRHALREGDRAIGLFGIDRRFGARLGLDPPGAYGLTGLAIDSAHQGRGNGAALMALLPDYLRRQYPDLTRLHLAVGAPNVVARDLFLAAGWTDTGRLHRGGADGPRHLLRLDLRAENRVSDPRPSH